jgi:hypothetical protein
MAVPRRDWRIYAGVGLLVWAAGLQVTFCPSANFLCNTIVEHLSAHLFAQVHMWRLQQRPEFREKFEKQDQSGQSQEQQQPKTQWSVRTRF